MVLALVAEGLVDGLRIDHIDGLADPRGYLERLRGNGVERVWVEKILRARRAAARLARPGDDRLRVRRTMCTRCSSTPAAEPALTELAGERRPFSEVAHAGEARAGAGDVPARARPPSPPVDPPTWSRRSLALLVYRTYVEPGTGRVDDLDRAAAAQLPDPVRAVAHARGARLRRVRDALPADDGLGHGQGCRGHRVLPLRPPARPERGRRRSRPVRTRRRGLPRGERVRAAPLPARACSPATTHDTKRSADVRARIGTLPTSPSAGPRTRCAGASSTVRFATVPPPTGRRSC